ncbi:MAG TPA: hypothetical protein VN976_21840 [Verrucomicrobiae bacterium]|nr:hypothetical protein [Verrucomicrobiae bacterium]
MAKKVTRMERFELRLARADGELVALHARCLEVLHLSSQAKESAKVEGIFSRRMQKLVELTAACEEEIAELKRKIAVLRTLAK